MISIILAVALVITFLALLYSWAKHGETQMDLAYARERLTEVFNNAENTSKAYEEKIFGFKNAVDTLRARGDKYRDALDNIVTHTETNLIKFAKAAKAIAEEARSK
jgi:predicted  nucleic acid-binding Zn-ribbon protein